MNFEVFNTKAEQEARVAELQAQGALVYPEFNGRAYTIKWKHG